MRRLYKLTLATLLLAAPAAGQAPAVYRIPVTGTVENGLAPYVARALREAEAAGAAAAYLDIDTPGGRVDAQDHAPSGFPETLVPAVEVGLRSGGTRRPPLAFPRAALRETFDSLFSASVYGGGFGLDAAQRETRV